MNLCKTRAILAKLAVPRTFAKCIKFSFRHIEEKPLLTDAQHRDP